MYLDVLLFPWKLITFLVTFKIMAVLMALSRLITLLVLALAVSRIGLGFCSVVKGSLSCNDCGPNYDYSGIRVLVKCDKVKKMSTAITTKNGAFTTELPSDGSSSAASTSPNCVAELLGGRTQLYAQKKNMVSKITSKEQGHVGINNSYTLLSPLSFSKSCPGKCEKDFSSKTFFPDCPFPFPPEYGLSPSYFYIPWLPIIGIP